MPSGALKSAAVAATIAVIRSTPSVVADERRNCCWLSYPTGYHASGNTFPEESE